MLANTREKAGKLAVNRISSRDEAVLNNSGLRCESVLYDFDNDGGATGTISFGRILPEGAVVVRVFSNEITAVAGATDIDLKAGSTDLITAVDLTADAGFQSRALTGAADGIALSADAELKMDINTAAATAGKVRFFVEYLLPND